MQGEQNKQQQPNNQVGEVNQQHHESHKCPRCESLNTKFCYYNNYSMSQPRYFCKACKRYWTQGGTLRNVPIGGGSRKGKRAKAMSSTLSSSSVFIQPHQQAQDHHERSLIMSSGPSATLNSLPRSQYYPSGAGYLTSMPFSQDVTHLGCSTQLGSGGGASNLGLLHGFNAISSYGQRHMRGQFLRSNMEPSALYPSKDHQGMLLQPTRSSGVMTDWPQSFVNKTHASASNVTSSTSQTALWSATIGNNTTTPNGADSSINSTKWSDDFVRSFAPGPSQ